MSTIFKLKKQDGISQNIIYDKNGIVKIINPKKSPENWNKQITNKQTNAIKLIYINTIISAITLNVNSFTHHLKDKYYKNVSKIDVNDVYKNYTLHMWIQNIEIERMENIYHIEMILSGIQPKR